MHIYGKMYTEPVTVPELKEHWKALDKLVEGEAMYGIPLRCMPPWNDLCSDLWWESHLVDDGYFSAKNYGFWGVYRILALASDGDLTKPATLARIGAQDATGTLYIGSAGRLSDRLNQILRSSHHVVDRLRSMPVLNFSRDRLAIALHFTETRPLVVERDLIAAYANSFGEVPPLNSR